MKYLLDTCTISDFVKGDPHTLIRLKATSPNNICVSTISVMEVHFGLYLNKERANKIENIIYEFFKAIHILDFAKEDAQQAGFIRAKLKKQGNSIGYYDVLLAGCALVNDLVFVTSNVKEFDRIEDLTIENWRL